LLPRAFILPSRRVPWTHRESKVCPRRPVGKSFNSSGARARVQTQSRAASPTVRLSRDERPRCRMAGRRRPPGKPWDRCATCRRTGERVAYGFRPVLVASGRRLIAPRDQGETGTSHVSGSGLEGKCGLGDRRQPGHRPSHVHCAGTRRRSSRGQLPISPRRS
jgi:hypothetical protein